MTPPTIQATLFDAAGTILRLRDPVGVGYARVARRHGIHLQPEAAEDAFRSTWKAMLPLGSFRLDTSPTGGDPEKAWWRSLVQQVIAKAAPGNDHGFDAYFEDLFADYAEPDRWCLFPDTVETLDRLSRRKIPLFTSRSASPPANCSPTCA